MAGVEAFALGYGHLVLGGKPPPTRRSKTSCSWSWSWPTRPAERVAMKASSPLSEASVKKEALGLVPVESR